MKFTPSVVTLLLSSVAASRGLSERSLNWPSQSIVAQEDKVPVPGDNPLTYCNASHDDDILVLEHVNLTPNPPAASAKLTIEAVGTVLQHIEEGAYVDLQVKYGLIRLNTQADLCEQITNVDLSCPIEKGKIAIVKDIDLPKEIPPGKYTVLADAYTVDRKKIACLQAEVVFSPM
ncbi:putative Phosphatidylglycerol/phosphatidylinositol transfer protein [Xylogone sp. PMI_703]|nr:putative Phosphatidylglycerol/phosphatidylinositol transfer protein [Xylogone sp. PMI_703]